MRDLIEICRELELRRIDVLKGAAIAALAVPVFYIAYMALYITLSTLEVLING